MAGRTDLRLGIADVAPSVSCRMYSARAVVGEWIPITATVFGEGHDLVAATVVWTAPKGARSKAVRQLVRMQPDTE
ncbi:MAG: DUF3416 domain-containing protein, partial [Actinomycetota bacterium]|nr:DUF3416 domain-containing protein [Actinomycetota bacterium]